MIPKSEEYIQEATSIHDREWVSFKSYLTFVVV